MTPSTHADATQSLRAPVILGVDPGARGALALLDFNGAIVAIHDMPVVETFVNRKRRVRVTSAGLAELLRDIDVRHAFIEAVNGMKSDAGGAAHAFGVACGVIDGVLGALGIPLTYVTPGELEKERRAQRGPGRITLTRLAIVARRRRILPSSEGSWPSGAALIALHGLRSR